MHPSNHFFYHEQFPPEQTKITKTLLLQSLQTDHFSHQYQISIPYDAVSRELDLTHPLHEIFFETLNSNDQYQVFYFSSLNGCFCFADVYPWTRRFVLGEEFVLKEEIFVAFRKVCVVDGGSKAGEATTTKETEKQKEKQTKKKRRVNDRTILQTLQKVSLWRSKCEQEKITFEQASKEIDIPKKTLDDYYALIRTGEEFGFDFEKNYEEKIGVLRQFVKERQKEIKLMKDKKKPSKGAKVEENQLDGQKVVQRKMSIIDKMMLEGDSQEDDGLQKQEEE